MIALVHFHLQVIYLFYLKITINYQKFHLKVFGLIIEQNILHLFQEIKINIKLHLSEILYLNLCSEIYGATQGSEFL